MDKYIVKWKETRISRNSMEIEANSKEEAELKAEQMVFRFLDINDGEYVGDITVLTQEEYEEYEENN